MSEETPLREPIGLVGVGLMGMAFAHRLRGAGLPVVGFDVDPARLKALAAIGGERTASVDDVVRRCAIILVVVFSADQADGVLCEIAASDGRPRTVVLSITCDPERTVALAQRATAAGLRFIEAPVSGTRDQVLRGDGVGLLGGEVPGDGALTAMFDALMPRRFHVGKVGDGAKAKLAVNLILNLNRVALAEGLVLAERMGLDVTTFFRDRARLRRLFPGDGHEGRQDGHPGFRPARPRRAGAQGRAADARASRARRPGIARLRGRRGVAGKLRAPWRGRQGFDRHRRGHPPPRRPSGRRAERSEIMIEAAVVGLGRWGQAIVNAVQGKSAQLRFVRGVCKEPDAMAAFAAKHKFELSTQFDEVVADPRVRAVVLATPHSLHVDQVAAVAKAGKAVWCEKPLALTLAEAERAVAACRRAGVVLGLGNSKRTFASMLELKRVVAAGTIGDVLHIEGHFTNEHSTRVKGGWRDDPRESPGGGMTGAGLHVLDAFVNLVGPIARVDARLYSHKPPPDPRDAVAALIDFTSGATGLMATVRAGPTYWRVHVFGTRGWAEALGETKLTVAPIGQEPQTKTLPATDSLAALLDRFAEAVEGGPPFLVAPEEMLDVVGAFEALIASTAAGRPVAVGMQSERWRASG